jgi:hypothetical protein
MLLREIVRDHQAGMYGTNAVTAANPLDRGGEGWWSSLRHFAVDRKTLGFLQINQTITCD